MAKGGGSANKTFLFQRTKALLNEKALEKVKVMLTLRPPHLLFFFLLCGFLFCIALPLSFLGLLVVVVVLRRKNLVAQRGFSGLSAINASSPTEAP